MEGTGKNELDYRKMESCGVHAARDSLRHFWMDTCYINKPKHTELSEAITSIFRWRRYAQHCYVYLSDVSVGNDSNVAATCDN